MTQPDLIDRLVDCSAFGAHDARELCSEAADEIDRLRAVLVYEQHLMSRIGTHSDACWKWGPQHYECAMREITRQRGGVIETWREAHIEATGAD
jgi:hypothetical protein